jgi:hypothetical protein
MDALDGNAIAGELFAAAMTMSCTHLDQLVFTEPPDQVEGCPECLRIGSRWVHLRMCPKWRSP